MKRVMAILLLLATGCSVYPLLDDGARVRTPDAYTAMVLRDGVPTPLTVPVAPENIIGRLESLNREVNWLMEYANDLDTFDKLEHWKSHASLVNLNKKFIDDCDGSAWTKARLIQERGIVPDEDVKIVLVSYENKGHMIVVVTVEGKDWIMDNRYKWLTDVTQPNYTYRASMKLSEEGVWRKAWL